LGMRYYYVDKDVALRCSILLCSYLQIGGKKK
jgi:hypothetical protein